MHLEYTFSEKFSSIERTYLRSVSRVISADKSAAVCPMRDADGYVLA